MFGPVVLVGVLNDDVLVLLLLVAVREDGGYLSLGILEECEDEDEGVRDNNEGRLTLLLRM